jgi:putative hydrolase of the HAD superfamily
MQNAEAEHAYKKFKTTNVWIFDLDNTLYPAKNSVFAQVEARMNEFIAFTLGMDLASARTLRREYYVKFGTTLAGLMRNHDVKPENFLEYVHDIDLSPLGEDPELGRALAALPGRRFVFTNGSRRHAERVTDRLGLMGHFDDLFDIAAAGYTPKPAPEAYQRFLQRLDVKPVDSAMFEDLPHNLENPHVLGMNTVLVRTGSPEHPGQTEIGQWSTPPAHIHYVTDDLTGFLKDVATRIGEPPGNGGQG